MTTTGPPTRPLARLRRRAVVAAVAVCAVLTLGGLAARQAIETFDRRHDDRVHGAVAELTDWLAIERAVLTRVVNARGYLLSGDPEFLRAREFAGRNMAAQLAHLRARHAGDDIVASVDDIERRIAEVDRATERVVAARAQSQAAALAIWEQESRGATRATFDAVNVATTAARTRFIKTRDDAVASGAEAIKILFVLGIAVMVGLVALAALFARTARDLVYQHANDREQTMFQLLDQLPVGVFVVTPDGKPWFVNRNARDVLGALPAVGDTDLDRLVLVPTYQAGTDSVYPSERAPLTRALAGEVASISDMELHRGDQIVPLHVHGGPVRGRDGEIAFAVATFQDVHALHRVAHEDALTGLSNRLAATHVYNRERLRCERSARPLAVAILDLDRFKSINDQHGHAMGDEVLRRVAGAVTRALRKTDLIARWGGEELVVLLPETEVGPAEHTIVRCLVSVMDEAFIGVDARRFKTSFSAGVVTAEKGESIESVVARADKLLYAAKAAGRARVFSDRTDRPVTTRILTMAERRG